jgi:hypothetical protein
MVPWPTADTMIKSYGTGRTLVSIKGQFYVAAIGAAAGLLAVIAYWAIATPEAEYRDVAIGALVYATGYALAVPRAISWLKTNPQFLEKEAEGHPQI